MAKQMLSAAQLSTVLFSAQLKAAFFLCHLIVTLWTSMGDILPIQAQWNEATSKSTSTWGQKETNSHTRQPLHHRGILLDNCIDSWSTIWTSCPHWRVSFNLWRCSHWSSYIHSYTQVQFIKTNYSMFFGKGAASSKFSDILPLSQSEGRGADYVQPFALPHIKCFMITLNSLISVEF